MKDGVFRSRPVCDNCHCDPEHRKRVLKMHFFPADAKGVVEAAGGSNLSG